MKPLLAHVYEPHRVTYPCYVQPKLNGIRALYQNGRFQSRDEIPFPIGLLDHLAKPLLSIFEPSVILDGELYYHPWNWDANGNKVNCLQRIASAVTPVRNEPNQDTKLVEFHVFDVVNYSLDFLARQQIRKVLDYPCVSVATGRVDNQQEADSCYASWVGKGYEGAMYRLGDCPYTTPKQKRNPKAPYDGIPTRTKFLSDQDNRVWHLLKRKDWQDDEFLCVGIQEGQGKYQGMVGALEYYNKDETTLYDRIGKGPPTVGSGLTDSQREFYWSNPPIGKLIKVKYLVLSQDGIPLNPTILAIL